MKTKDEQKIEASMLDASVEIAGALHGIGAIGDDRMREYESRRDLAKATVRGFDATSLTPLAELTPEGVRALREREGASQALMARYLGVATATVGQWERGQRKPEGPAAKLLSLVQAHGLQYIR